MTWMPEDEGEGVRLMLDLADPPTPPLHDTPHTPVLTSRHIFQKNFAHVLIKLDFITFP